MVNKIKSKKGALSLSMDTIVVLILAIVLIGLGLALIKNIFSSAESKVKTVVASHEVINPPTLEDPLTLNPPLIEVRSNEAGISNIAFLNPSPDEASYQLEIIDSGGFVCPDTDPATPDECPETIYSAGAVSIKSGQNNIWRVVLKPKSGDTAGTIKLFTARINRLVTVCTDPLDPATCTTTPTPEYQKNVDFRVKI